MRHKSLPFGIRAHRLGLNTLNSHRLHIPSLRRSEHAAVIPIELRHAFITHFICGSAGAEPLEQHQAVGFDQTQTFLILAKQWQKAFPSAA
jgi:hypothetical protein